MGFHVIHGGVQGEEPQGNYWAIESEPKLTFQNPVPMSDYIFGVPGPWESQQDRTRLSIRISQLAQWLHSWALEQGT